MFLKFLHIVVTLESMLVELLGKQNKVGDTCLHPLLSDDRLLNHVALILEALRKCSAQSMPLLKINIKVIHIFRSTVLAIFENVQYKLTRSMPKYVCWKYINISKIQLYINQHIISQHCIDTFNFFRVKVRWMLPLTTTADVSWIWSPYIVLQALMPWSAVDSLTRKRWMFYRSTQPFCFRNDIKKNRSGLRK